MWVWKSWGIGSWVNILIIILLGSLFYEFEFELVLFGLSLLMVFMMNVLVKKWFFFRIVDIYL